MKESMGDRIKRLRLQHNLTQEELGNKVGLKRAAINKYEKGNVENMKRSIIEKMSSVFDVSPSYLMALDENYDNSQKNNQNILNIYNKLEEPRQKIVYATAEEQLHEQESTIEENNICYLPTVDNSAAAANPTELAYGDISIEEQAFVDVPAGADFAVPIHGDSMEPTIHDGDYVFVKTQNHIENGEIALVEIDGDGVTCKKIYFNPENGSIILHSLNAEYDDREIDPDRVRIIGKVLL